jgi:hypothetical protein
MLNATLQDDQIIVRHYVHLGVAVALGEQGEEGLIVPVIRDAHKKSLVDIARELEDIAKRARSKSISVAEVQGATFTLTNPGSYGALIGTPIINYPTNGDSGNLRDCETAYRYRRYDCHPPDDESLFELRPSINRWDVRRSLFAARQAGDRVVRVFQVSLLSDPSPEETAPSVPHGAVSLIPTARPELIFPPSVGSPRFASKGIEKSSPAYSLFRSYALPSRTIAFITTNIRRATAHNATFFAFPFASNA